MRMIPVGHSSWGPSREMSKRHRTLVTSLWSLDRRIRSTVHMPKLSHSKEWNQRLHTVGQRASLT